MDVSTDMSTVRAASQYWHLCTPGSLSRDPKRGRAMDAPVWALQVSTRPGLGVTE